MNTQLLRSQRADPVWAWTDLMGFLLILLGIVVIAAALVATIAIAWFMGLCLIVGGAAQLFHTYRFTWLHSPVIRYLIAAVSILTGVVILKNPIVGAVGITLALAVYLFFSAVTRAALAFQAKPASGRGWLIFSSLISFLLGICLFVTFPLTSWVIPGVLLGVDLIFYGLSITMMAERILGHEGVGIIDQAGTSVYSRTLR